MSSLAPNCCWSCGAESGSVQVKLGQHADQYAGSTSDDTVCSDHNRLLAIAKGCVDHRVWSQHMSGDVPAVPTRPIVFRKS